MGEGIDNLSVGTRNAFLEIGRMVYARHGGVTDAKGHIGLSDDEGTLRIIKFNTHGGSTGEGNANAIKDCNNLRQMLVSIANSANLSSATRQEIKKELGLPTKRNEKAPTALLKRSTVAKVVEMIGGKEVWKDVKASYNTSQYKSTRDTSYETVSQDRASTNNSKEIGRLEDVDVQSFGTSVDKGMAEIGFQQVLEELGIGANDEKRAAIDDLVNRTLKDKGAVGLLLLNASSLRTLAAGALDDAVRKSLLRIVVANVPKQDREAFLAEDGTFARGFALSKDDLSRLALDAHLLDLCGENAGLFGVDNPAEMKAAVLQRLLEQDLCGTNDDVAFAREVITFGSERIKVKLPKYGIAALKAALGVDQAKKGSILGISNADRLHQFLTAFAKDPNALKTKIADEPKRKEFLALVKRLGSTPEEVAANFTKELSRKKDGNYVYPNYIPFLNPHQLSEEELRNFGKAYSEELARVYGKYADKEESRTGFDGQFIRRLTSEDEVRKYTLNGKDVAASSLTSPKAFKLGDSEASDATISLGDDKIVVKTGEGKGAEPLAPGALKLCADIEKMVPDPAVRFLLTTAMGMNTPFKTKFNKPANGSYLGLTEEQCMGLFQQQSGSLAPTVVDGQSHRCDLSVVTENDGDYAVLKSYVNASPALNQFGHAPMMGAADSVTLAQNWIEVTVRVKLGQNLPEGQTPVFSTEVRQLGASPFEKQDAFRNIMMFVKEAEAHGNSGDYYVKLSDDEAGLVDAGKRNIFRGLKAKAENDLVHARLKSYITTYYGGEDKIPAYVRREMTNFTGGHPLSASRIGKIWNAMKGFRKAEQGVEGFVNDPLSNPDKMFDLAKTGQTFLVPDEWRQAFYVEYRSNGVEARGKTMVDDLSPRSILEGQEENLTYLKEIAVVSRVGENLTRLVMKANGNESVNFGTGWSMDVTRASSLKIGDETFNGSQYYNEKLAHYRAQGQTAAAQRLAEEDTAKEASDRLTRYLSKGGYASFSELMASNDGMMKNKVLFAMAHLNQGSLVSVGNEKLKNIEKNQRTETELSYEVRLDEQGGISFSGSRKDNFTNLGHGYMDQSFQCDPSKSFEIKSAKFTYSAEQIDKIVKSDFTAFANHYVESGLNMKKGVEMKTIKRYVSEFNAKIEKSMVLKPEIKTAHIIVANPAQENQGA